jgi:uncharacterized protein
MLITPEELALHKLAVREIFPVGALDFAGSEFRQVEPVRLNARAELAASDIRIRGRLETRLELECDRCAMTMRFGIEHDFDLTYRPVSSIAREEEIEIPKDELGVGFYSGEGVDLADLAKEQVIIALPMKVVCRPDCQGLCAGCGANLNVESCRCHRPRPSSPFARLASS